MTTAFADGPIALAGHGRRLLAAFVDAVSYVVVVVACGAAGFVAGIAIAGGSESASDGWDELGWILAGAILGAIVGVLLWLVLVVSLVRRSGPRNGQTFGKQIVGIRAIRADHQPIAAGQALLREAVAKWLLIAVTSAAVSWVLGYADAGLVGLVAGVIVWYGPAFADVQHRALHDRLLDTRVIDAKRGSAAAPVVAADDLWPAAS
jgi:uncharacterized RDD family membrane protein YckC